MEKRHHVRASFTDYVVANSDGVALKARSVDISRRGIRVHVNEPDGFDSIRTIVFSLPGGSPEMEIPCHVARVTANGRLEPNGTSHPNSVGFIFDQITEEQLSLINEFVRGQKEQQIQEDPDAEGRSVPRVDCALSPVTAEGTDAQVVSVDNISTEGVLITFRGTLATGSHVTLRFALPTVHRALELRTTVMYTIDHDLFGLGRAGLRIDEMSELDRSRVRNYVVSSSASMSVAGLDVWISRGEVDPDYVVSGQQSVASLFRRLMNDGRELQGLFPETLSLYAFRVVSVAEDGSEFTTTRPPQMEPFSGAATVKGTFTLERGGNFFSTEVRQQSEDSIAWIVPQTAYRVEKRSTNREVLTQMLPVTLSVGPGTYHATLVDTGPSGFRCELELTPETRSRLTRGCQVAFRDGDRLVWGEVRHREEVLADGKRPTLQIGVESAIRRGACEEREIGQADWDSEPAYEPAGDRTVVESRSVTYRNERQQRIVAILNATSFEKECTVVVIPPAFGKKKESLAPLSMTLLRNFQSDGRELVTIRYDGIDRPGESDGTVQNRPRGYEMLHYRMSQGMEDLRTTLDFVAVNPHFRASHVVLVTFSMSALDARKLLIQDRYAGMVDQWISVMGVPAAQSTLSAVLGGVDAVGNFKMGIRTGVCGLMGHVIDMDRAAEDILRNKYAHITDARHDMKHLDVPVLWICGDHDGWIDPEEVHDIMTIAAPGAREILQIPSGHNLRTSDDAIRTFKRITEAMRRWLFGDTTAVTGPDKEETLRLIADERERLERREEVDFAQYWQTYLLGNGVASAGYDFYRHLKPFREFLRVEAALAEVEPGNRVADLGCGTGIFLETLVDHVLRRPELGSDVSITAVDLVEDALRKAREKIEPLLSKAGTSAVSVEYRAMNLDPNRLIPLARYLSTPGASIEMLRGKIEGLTNQLIDRICELPADAFLAPKAARSCDAASTTTDEARLAIIELNRAERFLRRKLVVADMLPHRAAALAPGLADDAAVPDGAYDLMTSSDLDFRVLNFRSSTLDLRLPFPDAAFDRIVASLFISYLFNPEDMVGELFRIVQPGGKVLVSSMRPDSDISKMFTDFVQSNATDGGELGHAREMLNEAASLFELEEDGYFRFYDEYELESMMKLAGFERVTMTRSLGDPAQVVIATGYRPWTP